MDGAMSMQIMGQPSEDDIRRLVTTFYDCVRRDPVLGPRMPRTAGGVGATMPAPAPEE